MDSAVNLLDLKVSTNDLGSEKAQLVPLKKEGQEYFYGMVSVKERIEVMFQGEDVA